VHEASALFNNSATSDISATSATSDTNDTKAGTIFDALVYCPDFLI